jgi:DNA processing protein
MPADLQARILTLLGAAPVAEDQLIRDLALPTAMVTGAVLALELDGSVARQPGGLLARAQG